MSPEQQRIKIAEACGLMGAKLVMYYHNPHGGGLQDVCTKTNPHPWRKGEFEWVPVPDYLNDLNAMHEAEKVLSDVTANDQFARYCGILNEMLCPISCHGSRCGFTIHSTAAQRAEAFLRTLGLWENEPEQNGGGV